MDTLFKELEALREEAKQRLQAIGTLEALEACRVDLLGKRGKIRALTQKIAQVPPELRPAFGQQVNALKAFVEKALAEKGQRLGRPEKPRQKELFDRTLPGIRPQVGKRHPILQTIEEIEEIFQNMGFEVVEGPEIETEFHNFTALNIPPEHPSRDSFDTFYLPTGLLLRSQTSTVQIRVMETRKPPLRIIAPGRVYRPDTVDASHSFMFHQMEGLMVDDCVTFSDLKGILHLFLRQFFHKEVSIRFRPHFFPFTEPSVEVDLAWEGRGWLEILGAGMVDPAVFQAVGYRSKKIQGLAFGLGIERLAMLRYGIPDIRLFYENDLRFLQQF